MGCDRERIWLCLAFLLSDVEDSSAVNEMSTDPCVLFMNFSWSLEYFDVKVFVFTGTGALDPAAVDVGCAGVCAAVRVSVHVPLCAPAMSAAMCCAVPSSSWYFTIGSPFLCNCDSNFCSNIPGLLASSIKASMTIVAVACCCCWFAASAGHALVLASSSVFLIKFISLLVSPSSFFLFSLACFILS